jgi:hypothetical protein
MHMGGLLGAIGVFVVLLALLVALRVWTGNRIEVKTPDMVLALVPIGLWLFVSGKVQELTFGDFKIVAAIKQASSSPVADQVTRLPVDPVRADPKEGLSQLAALRGARAVVLVSLRRAQSPGPHALWRAGRPPVDLAAEGSARPAPVRAMAE